MTLKTITGPETRTFDFDALEIRAEAEGETKKIRGHAAVFNKLSEDFGGWREVIDPGAFTDAIRRDDVRALVNHIPHLILGRNKAGTLTLADSRKTKRVCQSKLTRRTRATPATSRPPSSGGTLHR